MEVFEKLVASWRVLGGEYPRRELQAKMVAEAAASAVPMYYWADKKLELLNNYENGSLMPLSPGLFQKYYSTPERWSGEASDEFYLELEVDRFLPELDATVSELSLDEYAEALVDGLKKSLIANWRAELGGSDNAEMLRFAKRLSSSMLVTDCQKRLNTGLNGYVHWCQILNIFWIKPLIFNPDNLSEFRESEDMVFREQCVVNTGKVYLELCVMA